jgi:hypothetical protein
MLEPLEERRLLATVTWTNPAGGDWDTTGNWSTGALPGSADDVVIGTLNSGAGVTHAQNTTAAVKSMSLQAAGDEPLVPLADGVGPDPTMTLVANWAGAAGTGAIPFPGDPILPRLRRGDPQREFATSVNNHDTEGKLRGYHFAAWAEDTLGSTAS